MHIVDQALIWMKVTTKYLQDSPLHIPPLAHGVWVPTTLHCPKVLVLSMSRLFICVLALCTGIILFALLHLQRTFRARRWIRRQRAAGLVSRLMTRSRTPLITT